MILTILAGALLGALCYRARGMAAYKWPGRIACSLLIALPVALHWPYGTIGYLPLAGLSLVMLCRPHNPGAEGYELLKLSLTGLAFTAPTAVALAILEGPGNLGSCALCAAGVGKGLAYMLPRRDSLNSKYLWKELGFGALWGAATGAAL